MSILRFPVPNPSWGDKKKVFRGYAYTYYSCLASGDIHGVLNANNMLLEMRKSWSLSSEQFVEWEREVYAQLLRGHRMSNWKKED